VLVYPQLTTWILKICVILVCRVVIIAQRLIFAFHVHQIILNFKINAYGIIHAHLDSIELYRIAVNFAEQIAKIVIMALGIATSVLKLPQWKLPRIRFPANVKMPDS
jgi:hypothetical protein